MKAAGNQDVICTVCGASNAAHLTRCTSCGAQLYVEEDTGSRSRARLKSPEQISWRWVGIAAIACFVAQLIVLVILPFVVSSYDPQGLPGITLSMMIWFIVGLCIGYIGPGRCFFEAAIAVLILSTPTVMYLMSIGDVYHLPMLIHIVGCALGSMVTVLGSVLGYRTRKASQTESYKKSWS